MFELMTERSSRGRGGRVSSRDVINNIGYNTYPARKKTGKPMCEFIFGVNILKKARFITGDYVAIYKDSDTKKGLIVRISEENNKLGYKLTTSLSKKNNRISFTYRDGFPPPNGHGVRDLKNVIVSEEGITFDWPE